LSSGHGQAGEELASRAPSYARLALFVGPDNPLLRLRSSGFLDFCWDYSR
jgi:hypothetical protein